MGDRTIQTQNAGRASTRELDFDQPVVNIGGDPGNDITLTGDGVHAFHAALILQDGQYQLISLAPEADILVDGKPLSGFTVALDENQRIDIGVYSLFVHHNGTPTSMHISVAMAGESAPAPAEIFGEDGSEHILLNLLPAAAEVAVDQTATYSLEITNAGPIVASFHVTVQGVPEDWIQISPRMLNLNEGQRASVRIGITPPHAPTSAAGKHPISIIVTSPNYPRQRSVAQAELTIQPYYEFLLGNLSPREQRLPWRNNRGRAALPITNQSNSSTSFDVLALDDENGCSFDFKLNENLELHRQATVAVPAGETLTLPIEITPLKRILVALRGRQYHYTASVQVNGQPAAPQVLSGSVTSLPLFGWWSVFLLVLLLAGGLFLLLQPRINYFRVAAGKDIIELGDSTSLEWAVSPFATRLGISGIDKAITGIQSHLTVSPTQSTTYELTASNWLSSLVGLDRKKSQTVLVVPPAPKIGVFDVDTTIVKKGLPVNIRWSVTKADKAYLTIDEVVYELPPDQFSGVKSVVLEKDAIVSLEARSLSGSELRSYYVNVVPPHITVNNFTVWVRPPSTAAATGGTALALQDALPAARAQAPAWGLDWLVSLFNPRAGQPAALLAATPTPTPTTAPADETQASDFPQKFVELISDESAETGYRVNFLQPSRELDKGEQVMLEWDVDGVENVNIAPFTETLPKKGKQPYFPQESMNFTMTAKSGELEQLYMLPVTVFDGEPPVAPSIQIFQAAPTKSVGPASVTFSWVISGAWTRIHLTRAGDMIGDWLPATGSKKVTVSESSSFILTAWNGTLSSAKPIDITIDPTLKTSTLTITDVYPHAGYFRVGNGVNVYIDFSGLDPSIAAPSGSVIVTDDFSTCTITLPTKSCTLTFTTPGIKKIHAQYSGDKVYLPVDSPVYTAQDIVVEANQVSLSPSYFKLERNSGGALSKGDPLNLDTANLRVGQGLYIDVAVVAVNASLDTADTKGTVTVRYCRVDEQDKIIQTDCTTSGTATVKVEQDSNTMGNIGHATLLIQNFKKAGKFVMVFSYAHLDGSFEPLLMSTYPNGNPIEFTIGKGDLLLVPRGISGSTCTYKECTVFKGSPVDILFDARLMIKEDPIDPANSQLADLYSTYAQPSDLVITAVNQADPTQTFDWSDKCFWKKSDSGVNYQFLCQGVDFTNPVFFTYQFLAEDPNFEIISRSIPINVSVRTQTQIALTSGLLSNVSVGQKIDLQGGNAYVREWGADPVPGAVLYFNTNNGTGSDPALEDILVILSPSVGACEWDTDGKGLKLTQSSDLTATPLADQHCWVYFKKAGTYNLNFRYEGDGVFDGVETNLDATQIYRQSGIKVTYAPSAPSWNIFTTNDLALTFTCPSGTTSCANFAPESLYGTQITISQNPASSCMIKDDNGADLPGSVLTLAAPSTYGEMPAPTLSLFCTTKGAVTLTLAFKSPDSDNFSIPSTAGSGKTLDLTINSQPKTLEGYLNLFDPSTNTYTMVGQTVTPVTAIPSLYIQEKYQVLVKIPNLVLQAEPTSSDLVYMTLPGAVIDKLASTTTCQLRQGYTDVYAIPFYLKSSSAAGYWWEASCDLVFSSTGSISASAQIDLELNSNRITASTQHLDLPSSVTKRPVAMSVQVNTGTASGTINGTAGSIAADGTAANGSIDELLIDDTYTIVATLSSMRTDYVPADTDYFTFTWPKALDAKLKSGSGSTCTYVTSNSSTLSTYSFGLMKAGSTWTGNCSFTFNGSVSLNASDVITASLSSLRFNTSPGVTLALPDSGVGYQSFPLTYDIKMTQGASLTSVVSGTSPNQSIAGTDFKVGEEYNVTASLTNVRSDLSPLGNEYIQMSWPSGLDGILDTSNNRTTCTLANASTPGVYKLSFTKDTATNDWKAQCKFRFKSILSLSSVSSTDRKISLTVVSSRLAGDPTSASISLPSAGVTKEAITITPSWSGGLTSGTDSFYAHSKPSLIVDLADNHWQENVSTGLTDTSITVTVNGSSLACAYDSAEVSFTCPLDDNQLYASKQVSISYPESTYFSSLSNTAKSVTISAIPVTLDNDHIFWVDGSGNTSPFPENMQCATCAHSRPWYYLLYDSTYTLRVPVSIDDSLISVANQQAYLTSGTTVNSGTVTFEASGYNLVSPLQTAWNTWSKSATSSSWANNQAVISINFNTPGMRGGVANKWRVHYNDGGVFKITTTDGRDNPDYYWDTTTSGSDDASHNIHIRSSLAFNWETYDTHGFLINFPSGEDGCYLVYLDTGTQGDTCEDSDPCWPDTAVPNDDPNDPPTGDYRAFTNTDISSWSYAVQWGSIMEFLGQPEVAKDLENEGVHGWNMAINCHTDDQLYYDVEDHDRLWYRDFNQDWTDDEKIGVNNNNFTPSSSTGWIFYLLNNLYIQKITR